MTRNGCFAMISLICLGGIESTFAKSDIEDSSSASPVASKEISTPPTCAVLSIQAPARFKRLANLLSFQLGHKMKTTELFHVLKKRELAKAVGGRRKLRTLKRCPDLNCIEENIGEISAMYFVSGQLTRKDTIYNLELALYDAQAVSQVTLAKQDFSKPAKEAKPALAAAVIQLLEQAEIHLEQTKNVAEIDSEDETEMAAVPAPPPPSSSISVEGSDANANPAIQRSSGETMAAVEEIPVGSGNTDADNTSPPVAAEAEQESASSASFDQNTVMGAWAFQVFCPNCSFGSFGLPEQTSLLTTAVTFPYGIDVAFGRLQWRYLNLSLVKIWMGAYNYSGTVEKVRQSLSWWFGLGGLGLGYSLNQTNHIGFIFYPLSLGQGLRYGRSLRRTRYLSFLQAQVYYRLYLDNVHLELGAQAPTLWTRRFILGGRSRFYQDTPLVVSYLGVGF